MFIGIVVVVALAVVVGVWYSGRVPSDNDVAAVGDSTDVTPSPATDARLDVTTQFPGRIVYVSNVELPSGGSVVVEKNGVIIGSQYFSPTTRVGSIALNTPTEDGESYVAKLYADTNANGRFDAGVDQAINGPDDRPIQAMFEVTQNLPEKKG